MMKKTKGGAYPVTIEYECWKCPEWHETDSVHAIQFARLRLIIGGKTMLLPDLSPLYRWRYNNRNIIRNLFWNRFGRCTDCGRIKLQSNLWHAEPGSSWCQRCM